MKSVLIFAVVVGVAFGANTHGLSLDDIIDKVLADTDVNPTDGVMSADEITNELLNKWDTDMDGRVAKHEFVNDWVSTYGDSHDTTNAFFGNMDFNGDHYLTEFDLLFQMGKIDGNGDGTVTTEEFRAYIHLVHPSGHGHNG